jgi:hypothetical protein
VTQVPAADLLPKDRIVHPLAEGKWRHVYTVKKKPSIRPGASHLSCDVIDAAGEKVRISLGETEQVNVERKG